MSDDLAPPMRTCVLCEEDLGGVGYGLSPSTFYTPTGLRFAHAECGLREVAGGIGHHLDHEHWCEQLHDPDGGLSYRESAACVWRLMTASNAVD